MSSAPAMPVFPDAYLADTTHLSTEEHGAYLLLLMAMWRRGGSVPNDDADLARIVGLDRSRWRKTKKRLLPLLIVEGSFLSQKRLQKEWQYAKEKRDKNAANGRTGGRPKSNINNRLDKANGSVSHNPNESPHTHTHTHEKTSVFSERASAQKPRGWVQQRTPKDASDDMIQEIEEHELRRTEAGLLAPGQDVLRLSKVAFG